MLLWLSHAWGIAVLSAASVYDLRTTEVPDMLSIAGVAGGVLLHGLHSWHVGSLEPLKWSLGIGLLFSAYGWGMYFAGMWGGADAFGTSILGFAAPTALGSFGILHSANLFVNLMLLGFVYTVGFAALKGLRQGEVRQDFVQRLQDQRYRIGAELAGAAVLSYAAGIHLSVHGPRYFAMAAAAILLFRFLRSVEQVAMVERKPAENVEEGEVVSEVSSRIRGAEEKELQELEDEKVEVRSGVKFVPVFPAALVVTDLFGGGLLLLRFLVSL